MAPLIGRESEIAVLSEALGRAKAGAGGGLLLVGDAGVGKSALLDVVVARARAAGVRVLSCAGSPATADWAFSGLRQLLTPVLDGAGALLPTTRTILMAALDDGDADGVSVQRVALGVLQLLSDAGQQTSILMTVDDVQWLDRDTSRVLAFVARRLADDAVLLVGAARADEMADSPLAAAHLSQLAVLPLARRAAEALLDSRAPGMPALVRERLLAAAIGNPLALTELAGETDLSGPALPLTDRLEATFGAKARSLPEPAGMVAVVAAVNDSDEVAEALAAAGELLVRSVTLADLAPAEQAGLMWVFAGRLRFRHPLMRAAVERAVSPDLRQAVHAGLARSISGDADRRLWHAALATATPDESIAVELEGMARRRANRGGLSTAAVVLERAARLSPDPRAAARRRIAAIFAYNDSGPLQAIRRLAGEVDLELLDPMQAAIVTITLDGMAADRWAGPAGRIRQAELVLRHGADDPAQAVELLLISFLLGWWANFGDAERDLLGRAVDSLTLPEDEPRRLVLEAFSQPDERGAGIRHRLSSWPAEDVSGADRGNLGQAAIAVGAIPQAVAYLTAASADLRATSDFADLVSILTSQAWGCVLLAQHEAASDAVEEAMRVAGEFVFPRMVVTAVLAGAMVTARQGETQVATGIAAHADAALAGAGAYSLLSMVQLVRGTAALADGDPAAAFDALIDVCRPDGRAYQQNARAWALTDLMDAAAMSGRLDEVRPVHAELTELAHRTGSPQLLVAVAASAPLLADGDHAGAAFAAAFNAGIEAWPWQRGSLLMAYGRWLRRQRRRAESREPLRSAYEFYQAAGAPAWAERAAVELRASGESLVSRPRPATSELSSQELRIATLAAQGLTNREIGERLFMSHRTVRNTLYRIFPKLGVSARDELAQALAK
ncbi:DNA-binding CsgD family transcriptional regulator [Actinoplanes lutulentus]|uniref:Regulatory LuxR family protein n=1 Tax=Actinoplanes lutulentus TaxID=1287878 RepID=A0A327ZIT9_9ACTN|nr:LuxR family transcriptional regulator [Actinoplanes lutulentus]MBB2940564.1 DNA-binding CsgD family transcriptional regulator [Actinoplanes lutulentus]RAK42877.1 regulatory LuxR family protein [Actinoplanes lutulentus]